MGHSWKPLGASWGTLGELLELLGAPLGTSWASFLDLFQEVLLYSQKIAHVGVVFSKCEVFGLSKLLFFT